MEFKETRSWIGKVVSVAVVVQITLVMVVPSIEADYRLLLLEVTILGSVLGIDILRQKMHDKTLTQVIDLFNREQ